MACHDCSDLCLCACHGAQAAVSAPVNTKVQVRAFNRLFDLVSAKRKVFQDDLAGLGLMDRTKLYDWLNSRHYFGINGIFIYQGLDK
jgi:hypothetical protein